jgi:AraC-like DNA-binding protein
MLSGHDDYDRLVTWTAAQGDLQAWVKDVRSRFVAVSGPLARSCGADPAAMTGRTEEEFFLPEQVAQFRRDDRRAIARNEAIVVEEVSSSGRYLTRKRPVRDRRGRVIGTLGVARHWTGSQGERGDAPARPSGPPWLDGVRERLERDFRRPIRVSRLAAEVERHPNYVSRAFAERVGVPPVEWVHRLRIEWAANAIGGGREPLVMIAQLAGFADQAHLTRVFKRYFGVTPAAYRRAMQEAEPPRTLSPTSGCPGADDPAGRAM